MGHKRKPRGSVTQKRIPVITHATEVMEGEKHSLAQPSTTKSVAAEETASYTDTYYTFNGKEDESWISKITGNLILVVLCVGFIRYALLLDFDKRVYNHKPGACYVVRNLANSTSHMEYVESMGILFITQPPSTESLIVSTSSETPGSIFALQIAKEKDGSMKFDNLVAIKLRMETTLDCSTNPHSILSESVLLYTRIESLCISSMLETAHFKAFETFTLLVVGSVCSLLIHSTFKKSWLQTAETILQTNWGNLVFYDGKKGNIIDNSIAFPTAIAVDNERSFVYVSSYTSESIKSYTIERDFTITKKSEISLLSSPYQLFVEAKSGDIWITSHPVFRKTWSFRYFPFIKAPITKAPTHVLRIRFQEDQNSWVLTEPYANGGDMVSSGTSFALIGEAFALGSGKGKTVICKMNNFMLA